MANKDVEVRRNNNASGLASPLPDMSRMIERFFSDPFGSLLNDFPSLQRRAVSDIKETENGYVLSAEVPGIPQEDIEVNVNGNMLTIHAESKQEQKSDEQGFQREYRSFRQAFTLPSSIDANRIEAHCENGLLQILLPKTEQAQPKRIQVQTGKNETTGKLGSKSSEKSSQAAGKPEKH